MIWCHVTCPGPKDPLKPVSKVQTSRRVKATDAPCIVKTKQLMAGVEGVISLAQGIVHWAPPAEAIAQAAARATDGQLDQYGPANGLPELVDALKHKLREENGLEQVSGSAVPNMHKAGLESSDLLLE